LRRWFVLCCLLLASSSAHAAGLNLAWDQCLSEGGVAAKKSACAANTGYSDVVGSFVPTQPHPGFLGLEILLDVQSETPTLPDWWQFFNSPSCRENALSVSFDFTGAAQSACSDPFSGQAMGGMAAYVTVGHPRLAGDYQPKPNAARIYMAVALENAVGLAAGTEYYCFRLRIGNQASSGASACAGCATPACMTLSEVRVYDQGPQVPRGEQAPPARFERINMQAQGNLIGWQDTGPACQSAVKNKTWGQLKSMYR
jgi:hypothetical protein